MDINKTAEEIYLVNQKNGFWAADRKIGDRDRNIGEALALLHSEISEALEADRKGRHADEDKFLPECADMGYKYAYEHFIKDTFEAELAGTFIRLADIAHGFGVDLAKFVRLELDYNKLRAYKHGVKY